jgi:hypothetical protein
MKRVLLILVLVVAAGLSACNSEVMQAIDPAAQAAAEEKAAQAEREYDRKMKEIMSSNESLTAKLSAAHDLVRSRFGSNAYSDAYWSRIIADAEEFDTGKISKVELDARIDEARARLQQQEDAQRHAQNVETTNDLMLMNNEMMMMTVF